MMIGDRLKRALEWRAWENAQEIRNRFREGNTIGQISSATGLDEELVTYAVSRMNIRLTTEQKVEKYRNIRLLFSQGSSVKDISKKHYISDAMARYIIKDMRPPREDRDRYKMRTVSAYMQKKEGTPLRQIAINQNCSIANASRMCEFGERRMGVMIKHIASNRVANWEKEYLRERFIISQEIGGEISISYDPSPSF